MVARRAACLSLLLLASPAAAQMGPAPTGMDLCGAAAMRVARFASRRHGWSTPRPQARPLGVVGRGVIWHVYDSPACCGGVCSSTSERDDALVGVVGGRLFALSLGGPTDRMVVAGENRLVQTWRPRGWAAFLRAARALPRSAEEAISIAWLVYVSAYPEQGLVTDVDASDLVVMEGRRPRFSRLVTRAVERFHEPVRSRARGNGGGFDVVLYTSRHIWFRALRGTPSGVASDTELRRVQIRILASGVVEVHEDVPVGVGA